MNDTARIAINKQERKGSGRFERLDYRVNERGNLTACHFVTGTLYGMIDLEMGNIVAFQDKYRPALENLYLYLVGDASRELKIERLTLLKDYPLRNATLL